MSLRRVFRFASGLLGLASAAGAHELGTIRTTATFEKEGRYRIEVVVDREHLPPGFGSEGRLPTHYGPIENLPRHDEKVGRILAEVADHSTVAFDGRVVVPRIEWAGADPKSGEVTLRFSGSIPGGATTFTWSNTLKLGSYLLTLQTEGEQAPVRQWLEGGETSPPFRLKAEIVPPTRGAVAVAYLKLGYTHIVPKGADHILFVLGIFLLSVRLRPVLLQVTAFTVAHTITLGLTIYGVFSLRSSIVEPLIAVSIVYVAIENIARPRLTPWRVGLVFGFGLLHGMGFAGVLSQLGLPRSEFLTALLCFNGGVELGQLTVILVAFLLFGLPFREKPWYRQRVVIPASLAIAVVGLEWAVQRIVAARL